MEIILNKPSGKYVVRFGHDQLTWRLLTDAAGKIRLFETQTEADRAAALAQAVP